MLFEPGVGMGWGGRGQEKCASKQKEKALITHFYLFNLIKNSVEYEGKLVSLDKGIRPRKYHNVMLCLTEIAGVHINVTCHI